ncbi:MAG: diguanylate cyclase [Kiritimatiellia bacterium]
MKGSSKNAGSIVVLGTDPEEQHLLGGMLQEMGCRAEQVYNPLDMIQILQRREFDLALISDAWRADGARLMWYARSFQPWLQGIMYGPGFAPEAGLPPPVFMPADILARIQTPFRAGVLRGLVEEALLREKKIVFAAAPDDLGRGLFFLEKLRAFLPELLDYHQSFPLAECLQAGITGAFPCRLSGALIMREKCPVLKIHAAAPVTRAFLEEVQNEILAGYKMFVAGRSAEVALEVDGEDAVVSGAEAGAVGSLFAIPLVSGQQFQGMLAFASPEAGVYSGAQLAHVCHVANHLSRIFPDLSRMQNLVVRDELTGLNNRRSFEIELRRAWQICRRYRYPIGLIMMDLDRFKSLNDNYGHMIGDAVLREFARILETVSRKTDVLARFGGDEFAAILTNTGADQAASFARRLQEAVATHVFCAERYPLQLSVSIGVAGSDQNVVENESDLLLLADRACYNAKDGGGGLVGLADESSRQKPPAADAASVPEAASAQPDKKGVLFIIDDEEIICRTFEKMLAATGFEVFTGTDPRAAVERVRAMSEALDVALVDLKMPGMNGIEVIQALKALNPEIVCIVLTGFASVDNTIAAMRAGAYDFMQKPVSFDELVFTVRRGVECRRLRRQVSGYRKQLEDSLDERTRSLNETARALENSYMATMEALAAALTVHETDTVRHDRRVAEYAVFLARRMNVESEQIDKIRRGALLHDIGKIGIPDAILRKAASLNDAEKEIMRRHAAIGYNIVRNIPFLAEEAEMVYQHHENYDGTGYPRGIAGRDIVFGARLFAVVDTFDALCSDRVYRKGVPVEQAVAEIKRCSGTQFDPEIVKAFLACYGEMAVR